MQTLHDSMMATKAVEYLMSAAFLLLFPFFWRFLNSGREKP